MKNKSLFVKPPYRKRCVFKNLDWLFYQVKAFFQRGKHGYSGFDLANLDCYLTHILAHSLKDFGMHTNQVPYRFLEMFDNEYDAWDCWRNYVIEMAQHFYNSMEENKNEVMPNKYEKYFMRCKSNHPMKKKYLEEESRIYTWQKEERDKGFEMLTEVFDNLWD